MKRVYKYQLCGPKSRCLMPIGAEILAVGHQSEEIYLWAKVDAPNGDDAEEFQGCEYRHFQVVATGQSYNDQDKVYLDTVHFSGLVFHVFEDRFYHNKT